MGIIKTRNFELAVYMRGNPDSKKLAIVIPGRLDSKDYVHNVNLVDYLAKKEYFALSFDPPGIWKSPGSIKIYTTTNSIKAVNELINYFGNRPTLLAGHSRGGTIAMLVGVKNPLVKCFIAIMSYYGAPSKPSKKGQMRGWEDEFRDPPPGDKKTKKQIHFRLPMDYFKDGAKYNVLKDLKKCDKPKLFFYGTADIMNDAKDVKKMYAVSHEPKMIFEIDAEHDYRRNANAAAQVNTVVGKFLKKYSKVI